MKLFSLLILFIPGVAAVSGQNLIGYKYVEIRKYMMEKEKNMNQDISYNAHFRYLKYTDNTDSETKLFFFNADSVCTSIQIICDGMTRSEKIKEYDTLYRRSGKNVWIDSVGSGKYMIRLKDDEWSSTFIMEPVK